MRPEDGSSAIEAAAAAIGRMELGRLDEETTANVGIYPGRHLGQRRRPAIAASTPRRGASTPERAAEVAGEIADACAWGASEYGCDVDVRIEELFRGYKVPSSSPALALAEAGLRAPGSSRPGSRSAVAVTPTYCASMASTACCSPTAPTAVHTAERERRRPQPREDARGLRGILGAAAAGGA